LFVLVANLRKVKDQATYIEAAELTQEAIPAARFVIIGEGELRDELQQQIDRLNLQERVQLVGIQQDVRSWLMAADIGILTSSSEGSSNAVLEYMATALPAVLSDIPANRELVDSVFFKAGDAADLATQLDSLWKLREKREIMGQNYCKSALRYGTSAFRERAQAYYVRLASRYAGEMS
jgi:glycosyltransferase involved in cell wall biosynthesis